MSVFKEPTFWFALISSVCAGYTVLNNLYNRSKSLLISLNWFSYMGGQINVSFNVYNPSSENRTLRNINFLFEGKRFQVTDYPDILSRRKYADGGNVTAFSDGMPININPKSSQSVVVTFKHLPSRIIAAKDLDFAFLIDKKSKIQNISVTEKIIDTEQLVRRLNRRFR